MKKLFLLILFLPLLVFALDECPRFGLTTEDIPCIQPSTWNPGVCADHNLTLYDSTGGAVLNTSWYKYIPYCAFNITTLSEPGLYCYNSTIEDGCISLKRADNMLSITIMQIGLIVFFILLGLPFKFGFAKFTSWALVILEVFMTVGMIYLNEVGSEISYLLLINWFIVLVFGGILGFMAIFMTMVKISTGSKKIHDDGYTKFVQDGK